GRPGAGLRLQLRRPPDPVDPGRADQGRSRGQRRPTRLPLRHRLRGLLRPLRPSARASRGRLGPPAPDRDRPRVLEPDDRALRARPLVRPARSRAGGSRRRRGERVAGRLFAPLGLLPARAAGDGPRDLRQWDLSRLGPRPPPGRIGGRSLGRRVRRRGGAVRPQGVAGGLLRRRAPRDSPGVLGRIPPRAGPRAERRPREPERAPAVPGFPRRALRCRAAVHGLEPPPPRGARERDRGQPRGGGRPDRMRRPLHPDLRQPRAMGLDLFRPLRRGVLGPVSRAARSAQRGAHLPHAVDGPFDPRLRLSLLQRLRPGLLDRAFLRPDPQAAARSPGIHRRGRGGLGRLVRGHGRRSPPRGRLYVGMLNAVLPVPLALAMLWIHDTKLALALSLPLYAATALWLGPGTSTVQDLVLPRMRALASAAFLLVITLIGLAMGPYTIGRLSVATGDLRVALSLGLLGNVVALGFFFLAGRTLGHDEATQLERARAAGRVETRSERPIRRDSFATCPDAQPAGAFGGLFHTLSLEGPKLVRMAGACRAGQPSAEEPR